MSLSPYLTDYKSANEVEAAYKSGKDFILNDISSKWNGRACSIRDFPSERVELRYNQNRRVTVFNP